MNVDWKIFARFGIPGLSLGVFLAIMLSFDFQFPPASENWVGPIVVLFLLLLGTITLSGLYLYRPRQQDVDTADLAARLLEQMKRQQQPEGRTAFESLQRTLEAAVDELKRRARDDEDTQLSRAALMDLARGDKEKAISAFSRILEREKASGKGAFKKAADAARFLGAMLFEIDTHKASEAFREAVELDPEAIDGWNELGILLMRRGELDSALSVLRKAERLGRTKGRNDAAAQALTNIGEIYRITGQIKESIEVQEAALAINNSIQNSEGIAANYSNLGLLQWKLGNFRMSEDLLKKALLIEKDSDNRPGMASDYGNLGVLYLTLGNVERSNQRLLIAEDMLEKAIEIDESLGRRAEVVVHLGNLGMTLSSRADHCDPGSNEYNQLARRAKNLVQKALKLAEELNYQEAQANQWSNLGVLLEEEKDITGAINAWTKAVEIYAGIGMSTEAGKVRKWIQDAR